MFVLVLIAIATNAQLQYAKNVITSLDRLNCSKTSPRYDIQYEQQQLHQQKGVYFCDKYAKRTCCSEQNFQELKIKWFREYSNIFELSTQCQEAYQDIICSDCDGDIGQGVRRGLCPNLCDAIFKSCLHDLFQFDEKTSKLRFCSQSDVVCSQLKFILKNGSSFCNSLGYKVNSNNRVEEWIENKYLSLEVEPLCWDTTPSSKIWGLPSRITESYPKEAKKKHSLMIVISIIMLILNL